MAERTEEHHVRDTSAGNIAGVIKGLTFRWDRVVKAKRAQADATDNMSPEYDEGLEAAKAKLMKVLQCAQRATLLTGGSRSRSFTANPLV